MPPIPPKKAGVYRIVNTPTGKCYVGSGSRCVHTRIREHQRALRRGVHGNSYLQNAWNKYGEAAFQFEVLEMCWPFQAIEREQAWMDHFQSYHRSKGYNIAPVAGSNRGIVWPTEVKRKFSAAAKKRLERPGERERLAAVGRAYAQSDEGRIQLGNNRRGKPHTPEVRKIISEAGKGRQKSLETLEKMRVANLGKKLSAGHVEKMAAARRGSKASEETKAKMSASQKRRLQRPEVLERVAKAHKESWANNEERKRRLSEASRARWADPNFRARVVATMAAKRAERCQDTSGV